MKPEDHAPGEPSVERAAHAFAGLLRPAGVPAAPVAMWVDRRRVARWMSDLFAAAGAAASGQFAAAEWLLDNDYLIRRAVLRVQEDMPARFWRRLPACTLADTGARTGPPRVLAVAHAYLATAHMQVSAALLGRFLGALQGREPLAIAELWALPTMLRIALLERLALAASQVFPGLAPPPLSIPPDLEAHGLDPTQTIARALTGLRALSTLSWEDLFETVSVVEQALLADPDGSYGRMDFDSRDAYRRAVEALADRACRAEADVAAEAVARAAAARPGTAEHHVGFWLAGPGRVAFARAIGAGDPRRPFERAPRAIYFGSLALATAGALALPMALLVAGGAPPGLLPLALLLLLLPASVLAVSFVNWVVSHAVPPRVLPKLDFSDGIPASAKTVVAIPALVTGPDEARALARQLEGHFLASQDDGLEFVLLSDLADADAAVADGDAETEAALSAAIEALNRAHPRADGTPRFHLLHRRRRWNPAEGRWMGWERKRGKIEQFNAFLLRGERGDLSRTAGDPERLRGARFVVTADADTRLGQGTVARLAGTLAHPLNRPQAGPDGRIVAGYTVLQPRVDVGPQGPGATAYARLMAGDTAIDIYSRAVSDIYQDLFGEGSYAGKGIYDVAAFAASLEGRVPENRILSHDLFEGLHGRAGLVSDIVVWEHYPGTHLEQAARHHRWTRGDWQLLPWLFARVPGPGGRRLPSRFDALGRWKLFDNLRRSLVPPAVVALFAAGWLVLPGSPWVWTLLGALVLGAHLFTDFLAGLVEAHRDRTVLAMIARMRDNMLRWLVCLAFLLDEAVVAADAIARALWRMARGRRLLEWTTAAQLAARLASADLRRAAWRRMRPSVGVAVALAALVLLLRPEALPAAAPLLLAWILAPEIAVATGRRPRPEEEAIDAADRRFLRRLARRTWLYFETFAGPGDNWLPPDNVQEAPHRIIAHRTSPTNIGMMILASLTAWRFGHLGLAELVARTASVLDSLERMERFRGHVLNWVETRHLQPLEPRYVSMVDSGNLAASLIVLARAMEEAAEAPPVEPAAWEGLADLLDLVGEALDAPALREAAGPEPRQLAAAAAAAARAAAHRPEGWAAQLQNLAGQTLPAIETAVAEALMAAELAPGPALRDLETWLERSRHQLAAMGRDLGLAADAEGRAALADRARSLATRARALVAGMDFAMLYDPSVRLFHIGYDVTSGRMDPNHYDLLASEARIGSYVAIAAGQVPVRHWFHLGRPVIRWRGRPGVASWNGSLFEYLMPEILVPSPRGTLMGEAVRTAVAVQRAWGERHGIPWGVSESGFAEQDPDGNYRYRAFGVPELGIRRGLERDRVVAPYASMLALPVAPRAAVANLKRLAALGLMGRTGLIEAADYTPDRAPPGGFVPVRSWMAHHQGMGLAAIGNLLLDGLHARWFLSDPQMASADLLLSERVPWTTTPEPARAPAPAAAARPALPGLHAWLPDERDGPGARHLLGLGNGHMTALLWTEGGGAILRSGDLLLRGLGSAGADEPGRFLVIDEPGAEPGASAADPPEEVRILLHPHLLERHQHAGGITVSTFEGLAPDEPLAMRRVTLLNRTDRRRRLLVASVAEVVLARAAEHDRHPAFSRLFIESRHIASLGALMFRRRPRRAGETTPMLLHRMVSEDPAVRLLGFETDRRRFVGRGGRAEAPLGLARILAGENGREGFTLDPVIALVAEVDLPPEGRAELAFLTVAGTSEAELVEVAERHLTLATLDWETGAALAAMTHEAHRRGLAPGDLPLLQRLLSRLLAPDLPHRPQPRDAFTQHDLWAFGISGDDPILVARTASGEDTDLLRLLVRGHRWWRDHGVAVDLVLLHEGEGGYLETVRDRLSQRLQALGALDLLGRRAGIHLVGVKDDAERIRRLFAATGRLFLDLDGPPLEAQLGLRTASAVESPRFLPTGEHRRLAAPRLAEVPLASRHGPGGFLAEGRGFAIELPGGAVPPAPWANVITNGRFGTIVTESGLGWTWRLNAGENRLTPWTNDPVTDRQVEAIYLRDELTAEVWTPTRLPCGAGLDARATHAPGRTCFEQASHGLLHEVEVTVAETDPVKLVRLRVTNPGPETRRLTATYFADWLLGSVRGLSDPFLEAWYAPDAQALFARNGRNPDFAPAVAFLSADRPPHSLTTSRSAFLGPAGDAARPRALFHWDLGGALETRGDAAAAYQVHLDLLPGATEEVLFILGQGADEAEARAIVLRHRSPAQAREEAARVAARWERLLGAVEIATPDPLLDRVVNHWLLTQTVAARLEARAGFYQAGGAFGFRDQLQDVQALLFAEPALARAHILEAARRQFEEGDVLHWWHPPGGQGVRTRCSDDLLWLVHATARYVEATGDLAILDEPVPFLCAPPLGPDEDDRYQRFPAGARAAPLFEHLERALERAHALGADGLPLMGTGDWNDGMDRVGAAGRGQSLWLGWFLAHVIDRFCALARRCGREALAARWDGRARALAAAIERVGWDGAWYIRAIDDAGEPWGSAANDECRIDLISQAWAVLSGRGDPERARQAMASAWAQLVRPGDRIVRLLDPPFHRTPRDPGYIRAYPPGIRENGGQYSHAAAWAGLAFVALGDGARAKAILDRLNPARHVASAEDAMRYLGEPYVMAADIGGVPPHLGRAGWTWYTGAAGWTWRLAVEGLLGVELVEGRIALAPCLPPDWHEARVTLRRGGAEMRIRIRRGGAAGLRVDGADWTGPIPFPEPGAVRAVELGLAEPAGRAEPSAPQPRAPETAPGA